MIHFHLPISGAGLFFPHDDDVDYPTDIKGELNHATMPYPGMADENGEIKMCVVCGERASGFYFGALVCLPCKVSVYTLVANNSEHFMTWEKKAFENIVGRTENAGKKPFFPFPTIFSLL